MFDCLTYRMKSIVHVCSFIKRTNMNKLLIELFRNCSLNIRFIYNLNHYQYVECYMWLCNYLLCNYGIFV
ncbi:hypothetical protein Hanom_Chr00s000839g01665691 [Helianthus anomalus]